MESGFLGRPVDVTTFPSKKTNPSPPGCASPLPRLDGQQRLIAVVREEGRPRRHTVGGAGDEPGGIG